MNNIEEISNLIKKLPQEDLPEGYSFSLRQKLREEAEAQTQEQFNPQPSIVENILNFFKKPQYAVVLAAGCLMLLFTPFFFRSSGDVSVELYGKESNKLVVGEIALLRVEFKAVKDIDEVTFKVELPDGVTFVSAHEVIAESKALAFKGNITKQQPIVLPVAVKIAEEGKFKIKVKASKLGEQSIVLNGNNS